MLGNNKVLVKGFDLSYHNAWEHDPKLQKLPMSSKISLALCWLRRSSCFHIEQMRTLLGIEIRPCGMVALLTSLVEVCR